MKISSVLASLAGLVATTYAVPAPTGYPEGTIVTKYPDGLPADLIPRAMGLEKRGLEKRGYPGVYFCTDAHFSGYCVHIVQPAAKCVPLDKDLNDKVSSVGPDNKKNDCYFHVYPNCQGPFFRTAFPGLADLSVIYNGNFNDQLSSYLCFDD